MFAEAEAVAVACAKEELEATIATVAIASDLKMFFILVSFSLFELFLVFVLIVCCKEYYQRRAKVLIN